MESVDTKGILQIILVPKKLSRKSSSRVETEVCLAETVEEAMAQARSVAQW